MDLDEGEGGALLQVQARLTRIVAEERWDDLGALLDSSFFSLLLIYPDRVVSALNAAPEPWLLSHPRYLNARAIAVGMGSAIKPVPDATRQVFNAWVQAQTTPAIRDVLGVKQGSMRYLLVTGRLAHASLLADETLRELDNSIDFAGYLDVVPVVLIQNGVVKLLVGDTQTADALFTDAVRISQGTRDGHPAGQHAHNHKSLVLALTGNAVAAQQSLRYDPNAERPAPDTLARHYEAAALLSVGLIALESLDEEATTAALARLDDTIDAGDLWWVAAHLRARHALLWGDREEAAASLEHVLASQRSRVGADSLAGPTLRADLSDLYQAIGDLPAAVEVLKGEHSATIRPAVLLCSRARLDLRAGRPDDALNRITAEGVAARREPPANVLVVKAAAEMALGDQHAEITLGHAATIIRRTGSLSAVAEASASVRTALSERFGLQTSLPKVFAEATLIRLTRREREVLAALHQHHSTKAIAGALFVSANTAKSHLNALYRKLDVHTREQALRVARSLAIEDPDLEGSAR